MDEGIYDETVWEIEGMAIWSSNRSWYPSGNVTVVSVGEKSGETSGANQYPLRTAWARSNDIEGVVMVVDPSFVDTDA